MGKRAKEIVKKAGGRRELTQSVAIAVITIIVSLTIVFLVYPDALRAIADAFQGFQDWFLGGLGL